MNENSYISTSVLGCGTLKGLICEKYNTKKEN